MKTIWKYKLEVAGKQEIEIPHGSEVLSLAVQNNDPYIWVLVPDTGVTVKETLVVVTYATGQKIPQPVYRDHFLGTYQLSGKQVFHVFYNIV